MLQQPYTEPYRPFVGHSQQQRRRGNRRSALRQESVQNLRYGIGMLLGCIAVHWTKSLLRKVPILGPLTPVLDLLPTGIVGPALGAAVVYGIDEGDMRAAGHKVRAVVKAAHQEIDAAARDINAELSHLQRRHQAAARELVPLVEGHVDSLERSVVPILERSYRDAQHHIRRLQAEGERVLSAGREQVSGAHPLLLQAAAGRK